jgi:uncharacterized protein (DUF608 family)
MKPILSNTSLSRYAVAFVGLTLVSGLAAAAPATRQAGTALIRKNIDPTWVKSLYERGTPTVYTKSRNELRYIGMPVGGICAGGVYLGGDGRLWLWDIFNDNRVGIEPKLVKWERPLNSGAYVRSTDGACYIEPSQNIRPLEQGFALRFEFDGRTVIKRLVESDWDEIEFEAGYPIGTVRYTATALPVDVTLQAYSPFIPLNEDDSGLPATILSFSFKNKGTTPVKIDIVGWLENKVGIHTAAKVQGEFGTVASRRRNTIDAGHKYIVETLTPLHNAEEVRRSADYGDMCIMALHNSSSALPDVNIYDDAKLFSTDVDLRGVLYSVAGAPLTEPTAPNSVEKPVQEPLIGAVHTSFELMGEATEEAGFIISWYFPNLLIDNKLQSSGRYYSRYGSAAEVAQYVRRDYERLAGDTRLWAATWKDATLPHWFLERTFMTADALATTTSHRFADGRFWAWEGVGACPGTCTHVWHYAQAMAHIFPALERNCREQTELGIALRDDGAISFRAEMEDRPAIDGQAGTILRCYREHLMSVNDAFLRRNWDKIKRATQFIINQDKNNDGLTDTPLENTLDAIWDGEIAWIAGLSVAAIKAAQKMAEEMSDTEFAILCADYVSKGSANMDKLLFNGEYYIHRPAVSGVRNKLGSYNTCHIDQVLGQAWAYQLGMRQIFNNKNVRSALQSLWKYNFTTDVGPYIAAHKGGRPYALAGEGGMIMNTNPKNEQNPYGNSTMWQLGYFNECMTGFEYGVAAHFLAEGMTDEGLTIIRTIHDRYHAAKRNPYNEIECGDHYARAMASYGAFITACGFEYHGPKGQIRFAPTVGADNFRAPFTTAEGWGTYAQSITDDTYLRASFTPKWGQVQLSSFCVAVPAARKVTSASVTINGQTVTAAMLQDGADAKFIFNGSIALKAGETLAMKVYYE